MHISTRHGLREALCCVDSFMKRSMTRRRPWGSGMLACIPDVPAKRTEVEKLADSLMTQASQLSLVFHEHYWCQHSSRTDFSSQTTIVIAHSDPHSLVDPYVIHACRHFQTLGWRVVLVSERCVAGLISSPDWADAVLYRTCAGDHFISWKAALDCFPSLKDCKQLILSHDKLFGPLGSFLSMHARMENIPCDFWGVSAAQQQYSCLQSHYVVFRPEALRHAAFTDFFTRLPIIEEQADSADHEQLLSVWFCLHGLRAGVYCLPPAGMEAERDSLAVWEDLLHAGVPFLIHDTLLHRHDKFGKSWAMELREKNYPLHLVENYFERTHQDFSAAHSVGKVYGIFPPDVSALQCPVHLPPADACSQSLSVGLALHCYYPQMLPELAGYLGAMPHTSHVYVSTDTAAKGDAIRDFFEGFSFAEVHVRITPNKGWDIAPFLVGFADNLTQHDIILKIHTKQSPQHASETTRIWRKMIYDSLMGSQTRVAQVLAFFTTNPDVGMLAPPIPLLLDGVAQTINHACMRTLLAKHHVTLPRDAAIDFPAGSMFWARPQALRPWLDLELSFDDFGTTEGSLRDGALAHGIERLFFFGCGICDMRWGRLAPVSYETTPATAGAVTKQTQDPSAMQRIH